MATSILPTRRLRQPLLRHAGPGGAAVAGRVDAAARPAAEHRPRVHLDLPGAGDQHLGVPGIHRQAGAAGVGIDEQTAVPGATAVGGLEHAPLLLRTRRAAERAGVHDVRDRWVDDDAADAAGLVEAHARPRRAGIGGLVDAVANDVAGPDHPCLAGAGPDDVGVGRRDGKGADCGDTLAVEDGSEGRAAVGGLPHAAGRGAGIVDRGIARDTRHGRDAVADRGAHEPPLERLGLRLLSASAPLLRTCWGNHRGEREHYPRRGLPGRS